MPWGDVAFSMDRRTKEEDAVLLVNAANAGLSLRAVAGMCFWAFEDEVPGCEAFTLRGTPDAGICGVAARSFVRGERVLTEKPLVHWIAKGDITPEALEARLSAEAPPVQRVFWALSQNAVHGTVKHAFGIWLTNAHPTDGSTRTELDAVAQRSSAVFAHNARLNHSCSPNLHCSWSATLGAQTLHALRDIDIGEELTISYLPTLERPRAVRRDALLSGFGFPCACCACSLSGGALRASETRRARLEVVEGEMRAASDPSRAADAMRKALAAGADVATAAGQRRLRALQQRLRAEGVALAEERLSLLEQEGAVHAARAWGALEAASRLCSMLGDREEAAKWNAKAAKCALLALGRESAEFVRYAALIRGAGGK